MCRGEVTKFDEYGPVAEGVDPQYGTLEAIFQFASSRTMRMPLPMPPVPP